MSLAQYLAPDEIELAEHYPSRAEHRADLIVHLAGLLAAGVAGGVLFSAALIERGLSMASATALYALCMIIMLACSAVYNLTRPSPARRVLRRLDEAAIFLMIAGSYTPFTSQLLPFALAMAVTAGVWIAALAGAAGKVFMPQLSDRFWCVVYLAFGWMAALIMWPISAGMPSLAILLLLAGGVIYSAGVLIYLNHKTPFRRAIWHGFVLAGAGAHYAAIMTGVVMPGGFL